MTDAHDNDMNKSINPSPEEGDEESNEDTSRIEMAITVSAPMTTRPSPPRAVHINPSSSTSSSSTIDTNNSRTRSESNPTSTSNTRRKRVPAPKLTEDEALQADSNPTTPYTTEDGNNKDRFAALLALGVQHQQSQQALLPPNRRTASNTSTQSQSHTADSSAINATKQSAAFPLLSSRDQTLFQGHSHPEQSSVGASTSQGNHHAQNDYTSIEQAQSPSLYLRPIRSNSTMSLNNGKANLTNDSPTILQQHKVQRPTYSNSSSRGTSSTSTSTLQGSMSAHSNHSSSTTSAGGRKMAALAARWGSSASQKIHSMASTLSSSSSAAHGTSTSTSGASTRLDHPIYGHGSVNGSSSTSGTVASTNASGSNAMGLSSPLLSAPNQGFLNTDSGVQQPVNATSSSSNGSNTEQHGHFRGQKAMFKVAARLRSAANNLSTSSPSSSSRGTQQMDELASTSSLSSMGTNHSDLSSGDSLMHSNGSNGGMTKSSSLRSLSNLGQAISSSGRNMRKFSPSFSNSSSTNLNSVGEHNDSDVDSSTMGSGSTSTARRLGFTHRATASSLSGLGLGMVGSNQTSSTTQRTSPLSSMSSLSSNNHNTSSSNYGHASSASINRSASATKMKYVLGVQIPSGRAGEVFGAPLNVAADRTRLTRDLEGEIPLLPGREALSEEDTYRRREACMFLPAIAIRCLDYLNEYGKTEEGLYRIPGSTLQIANLKTIFDSGADVDLLSTLSTRDLEPSAVASCFKLWLRELPESLLHNMEREIDILLLEHTGNAASSKVTMAQAQSPPSTTTSTSGEFANQQQQPNSVGIPQMINSSTSSKGSLAAQSTSPLVINRIKDLFANHLPKENVILLREISYHLAHLASFSNVTKMTFSNLRLILSPTLRLSPVMLSLLVNEREQVFPKPGTFLAVLRDASTGLQSIQFNNSNLDLSLGSAPSVQQQQEAPKLKLSLPGEDGLPPVPPSKSPVVRQGASSSTPPTVSLRTPFSSNDSSWTSFSSPISGQASHRKSNASTPGYRASWHVVDFPPAGSSGRKVSSESRDSDDDGGHSNTPIARKFLNQRSSVGNLLEKAGSASPAPSESSRRSVSSNGTGSNILARTPTLTGRSPSPFFSSGAPPAALGFMAGHSRKRSSASSFSSIVSNSVGADGRPLWRSRKVSPQHDALAVATKVVSGSSDVEAQHQDEEEELSNSDTNTSICSSASSAKTPSDQHDLPLNRDDEIVIAVSDANNANEQAEEGDSVGATLDSRRATITAESFGQSFARRGQGKNANSEEMKRKRGSVMIMNMPKFD